MTHRYLHVLGAVLLCLPVVACTPKAAPACKYVALTFDDGPSKNTEKLLAVLAQNGVRATFFDLGEQERQHPDKVRLIFAAGHEIGNHTVTHAHLVKSGPTKTEKEIGGFIDIHTSLGYPKPTLFRPPYGETDQTVRRLAEDDGLTEVLWTVDSKDYKSPQISTVIDNSTPLQEGGIILMHDGYESTIGALPTLINQWKAKGFCFGAIVHDDTTTKASNGVAENVKVVAWPS